MGGSKARKPGLGVQAFLETLEHPMKEGIVRLRAAILKSNEGITERIKWNAPSFCWNDDDRVTFRLAPKGIAQLVLHRGVKPKVTKGFSFDDPSGLVEWAAPDRGVVSFETTADMKKKAPAVTKLVNAWMQATA